MHFCGHFQVFARSVLNLDCTVFHLFMQNETNNLLQSQG